MSIQSIKLTRSLYTYFQKFSLRESATLKKLRKETKTLNNFKMQISPEQGQFMALLIELLGAEKTLDIGTFTGYSALSVALALPSHGKVITFDCNIESTQIAKKYWEMAQVAYKIDLKLGQAVDNLQRLIDQGESNSFDFSFIDADKNNYDIYYELSLKLLRRGGLIAIDNVLWDGKVSDIKQTDKTTNAIRALNAKIFNDQRVTMSMIPIGDGLTLARKR